MRNGIIFVNDRIISWDLQVTLSKHYNILNVSKNARQTDMKDISATDFLIIDPDLYSTQELQNIRDELNLIPEANIIALTSQPEDKLKQTLHCKHVITKPFDYVSLFQAIEN